MTLTPEQFNKIAMKEDLEKLREEMMTKSEKNEILSSIDGLTKLIKDGQDEKAANQAAHDRIQNDVNEVRKYVKMDIKNSVLRDGE